MRTHSRILQELSFLKWFTFRYAEKDFFSSLGFSLSLLALAGVFITFFGSGLVVMFLVAYLMSAKYTIHDESVMNIPIHDPKSKTLEDFIQFHDAWAKQRDAHQEENKHYALKAKVAWCCVLVTLGVSLLYPSAHMVGFALALFIWDVPMPWLMEKHNAFENKRNALRNRLDNMVKQGD